MAILAFPKLLYREDGSTTKVFSQAEQDALGATWSESPTVIKRGLIRVACKTVEYVTLAANPKRKTVKIINDSIAITRILYAAQFPSGVSTTQFTWIMDPGDRWEMPTVIRGDHTEPETFGLLTAITETETGALNVTETVDS